MVTIQVGVFPGRVDSYAVEEGTSVAEVLALAGLSVGADQEIKMDGEVVSPDDEIDDSTRLVLLAKRIKAA